MRNKDRKVSIIKGNGKPFIAKKINRNELCPCGSGLKVKNCHNYETKYFTKKNKIEPKINLETVNK